MSSKELGSVFWIDEAPLIHKIIPTLFMHPRLTLLMTLMLTALTSGLSVILLAFYASIERNIALFLTLMVISLIFFSVSVLTIVLFFLKKLYYRGAISVLLVYSSLRQAVMFVLFCIGLRAFHYFHVLEWSTTLLLGSTLLFLYLALSQLFFYDDASA